MSTVFDWINGSAEDEFEHGETYVRLRAGTVTDPYSGETIGEDWSNPSESPLDGAYFASQSSTDQDDPVRALTSTVKQLIIPNPRADVARGDRIRNGARTWKVVGFPEADKNPFTGWQPTLVVDLEDFVG